MRQSIPRSLRVARAAFAFLASLGLAAPALGGPLVSATLKIAAGALPPATFVAAGATGQATSQLHATLNAGSAFAGIFTTTSPVTAAPPISGIQFTVGTNQAGVFTGASPGAVGGSARVAATFALDIFSVLVKFPVPMGAPGVVTKAAFGINVTSIAASWTVGPVTVATLSGTKMATGANGLTAGGAGTLVLVTPVRLVTNIAGIIPIFGTLTLTYVPEPSTALLLGSGIAALAAAGERTRRRRRR